MQSSATCSTTAVQFRADTGAQSRHWRKCMQVQASMIQQASPADLVLANRCRSRTHSHTGSPLQSTYAAAVMAQLTTIYMCIADVQRPVACLSNSTRRQE
eukprot:scpid52690/ scgid23025/ 